MKGQIIRLSQSLLHLSWALSCVGGATHLCTIASAISTMPASSTSSSSTIGAACADTSSTFMYFAFGSNLLAERIHINNPSAKFVDVAKLENFKLEFNYFSKRWQGAAATVNPVEDGVEQNEGPAHVWGVLWELHKEDMPHLDTQEGVTTCPESGGHVGVYQPLQVPVLRGSTGDKVMARTYQLIRPLERDRRPSKVYLDVIRRGAKENNLPEEYQQFLASIEHNGYDSTVDVKLTLSKV